MYEITECYYHLAIAVLMELTPEQAREAYESGAAFSKNPDYRALIRQAEGQECNVRNMLKEKHVSKTSYYRWRKRIALIEAENSRQHIWKCERRRLKGKKDRNQVSGQMSIFDFDLPPDHQIQPSWYKKI